MRDLIDRARHWFASTSGLLWATAAGLTSCILLGGGTRPGFLSDAILQLVAIPVLLTGLWRLGELRAGSELRLPLAFCLALVAVPLLQLVPLPPSIWTALPNRAPLSETFALLGQPLPWLPISVSPRATWLSALSLLPPVAVFLGTLLLGLRERRVLSLAVLTLGVVSVFVGLKQLAQGPESAWRFYEITNPSEAVGFFANRNHFSALLYAMTLFAAAWTVETSITFQNAKRGDTAWIVGVVAVFTVVVALVAAQAMARSRAGLGLAIVALFGALALALSDRRASSGVTPTRLMVGASAFAIVFAVQYALYRVLDRFADDPLQDARIAFARNTFAAAKSFLPLGSGMGTFVAVYPMFEKPQDALLDTFANRAHDDVLELSLEAGVAGLGLMALFLVWLAIAIFKCWRRPALESRAIDRLLAQAASIALLLLIAHSFVDYPLRTAAVMALFAFACALLIDPPMGAQEVEEIEGRSENMPQPSNVSGPARVAPSLAAGGAAALPPRAVGGRWGEDIKWPTEWRSDPKHPTDKSGKG